MIYSIAEIAADIIESLIIFIFVIRMLGFKNRPKWICYTLTAVFASLWVATIMILNHLYVIEGLWGYLCIAILVIYCRLALKHDLLMHIIVSILPYYIIMIISPPATYFNSYFMKIPMSDVIMMRNPSRVLLLAVTKILLILLLRVTEYFLKKNDFLLSHIQKIIILVTMIASFAINVTFLESQVDREPGSMDQLVVILCFLTINTMFLILLYFITSQNYQRMDNEILRMKLESSKRSIEETAEWNRRIETIRHDMKNHMSCLMELIRNGENRRAMDYIGTIYEESLKNIPNHIVTDHPTLNAVLNLKESICREKSIDLRCCVPISLPEVNDIDLCIILSNLFDNAIAAEEKEPQPEIKLDISIVGNYLSIKMKNRISFPVLPAQGLPMTTKSNKREHGYGILSVIDAVNRNDGMQEFYEDKGFFIANILLKTNMTMSRSDRD